MSRVLMAPTVWLLAIGAIVLVCAIGLLIARGRVDWSGGARGSLARLGGVVGVGGHGWL